MLLALQQQVNLQTGLADLNTGFTVRPSASVATGRVRSAGLLANYATLKETYAAGSVDNAGVDIMLGQWTDGTNLELNQGFFRFPLTALPPGVKITSAYFEFTKATFNASTASALQLLAVSAGTTVASADWQAASTLAALTNYGTIPSTGYHTGDTTYQIALTQSALTAIAANAGGNFDFGIFSQKMMDGTAPSASEQYQIYSDDNATPANRPALIITFSLNDATIVADGTVAVAADASVTLGNATILADGVVTNNGATADLAITLGNATITADGTVAVVADASITLANATLSGVGTVDVSAILSTTLADASISADAGATITADLSKTLDDATVTADGTVPLGEITADASVTLADATIISTAHGPVWTGTQPDTTVWGSAGAASGDWTPSDSATTPWTEQPASGGTWVEATPDSTPWTQVQSET